MLENWCEIFRTGKHIASNGQEVNVTEKDLDEIVSNFSDKNPDVPIVIGHPKTNNPAYGWVDKLKREGDKLYACYKDVASEFEEWVKDGRYKTRSISLKDNVLRHIGWLGAKPPAIKGLEAYQFEEDENALSFSEDFKFTTIAQVLSNLRDFLIEKYGTEIADSVVANWRIEDLKQIDTKTEDEIRAFCEAIINPPEPDEQNEYSEPDPRDTVISELKQKLEQERADKRRSEHVQFAENAVLNGNITPAQKAFVTDFMEVCYSQGEYEFSEGDEKSVNKRFKDFINSLKQVDFSETATGKKVELSTGEIVDFSDGVSIANAILVKQAEYEKQGISKTSAEILKELKKGQN